MNNLLLSFTITLLIASIVIFIYDNSLWGVSFILAILATAISLTQDDPDKNKP